MARFKVGDRVRIITDAASCAVMPGTILEIGLVEIIDNRPTYYLHGGDDWGFEEDEIELIG